MMVMGFKFGSNLTNDDVMRLMKQEWDVAINENQIYIDSKGDQAQVFGFVDEVQYLFHVNYWTIDTAKVQHESFVEVKKDIDIYKNGGDMSCKKR